MLPMRSSAGHATFNCSESTVEGEFSSNTLITGGNFTTVQAGGVFETHIHVTTEGRKGMRKLWKMIASGAFHNAAERYDPPKCHPKTRKAVLKDIMDWVQGLEDSKRRCYFMWLYGPAGAGKSAIAQTIAELCYELKLLAASFFFSRTATGRNDHSRLIATLTYQFCLAIPEIRTYVEDAVELDPNIFSLSLENQLQTLILNPLSHFHDNLSRYHSRIHPMLIIIDGLDECASANYVQSYVLQALAEKLPIPMFFLVASRPEPHIRAFFTTGPLASITTTLALDESYQPDADIKTFLKQKFNAIKQDHPLRLQLRELRQPWLSTVDIDRLVLKSSGQFIYASTVMKYVESPRHLPTNRLDIIFGIKDRGKDTPFAALDALYTYIFSDVEDISKVLEIFSIFLLVKTPTVRKTPDFITRLLGLRSGELIITLIDLHSILDIPSQADVDEIRILHASLGDFLLDQTRSGNFHINQGHAHANLAWHFMKCIPEKVTGNDKMSGLQSLSSAVFTVHCAQSYPTVELLDALWKFNIFDFWTLYFSIHISPEAPRASLLGDFFTWLKHNGSSKDGQDLYSYYVLTWDRYIRHSLEHSYVGPLESQYHIFLILPHFRDGYRMRDVLTWDTIGAEYHLLLNVYSLEYHVGDPRYNLLLTEFFGDPSRSGPFYLDGDKYASFAITFTKYLILCATRSYRMEQNWERGLSCLSILLPKASYSKELATLLKFKNCVVDQRNTLAQEAIDTYCKSASKFPVRTGNPTRALAGWLRSKFHGS